MWEALQRPRLQFVLVLAGPSNTIHYSGSKLTLTKASLFPCLLPPSPTVAWAWPPRQPLLPVPPQPLSHGPDFPAQQKNHHATVTDGVLGHGIWRSEKKHRSTYILRSTQTLAHIPVTHLHTNCRQLQTFLHIQILMYTKYKQHMHKINIKDIFEHTQLFLDFICVHIEVEIVSHSILSDSSWPHGL